MNALFAGIVRATLMAMYAPIAVAILNADQREN